MTRLVAAVLLVLASGQSVLAQTPSAGLVTAEERQWADIGSYATLGLNIAAAAADCRHGGEWDRVCLTRLLVKNGIALGVSETLKRVIHERRPCEPSSCGRDAGTGSAPSGHTIFSFVNVDPWGQSHLGLGVEFSISLGTADLRVLSLRHHWWDVAGTAVLAQGINAATRKLVH